LFASVKRLNKNVVEGEIFIIVEKVFNLLYVK